ncbi:hypothetical protein ACF0H5_016862 [Mactra antiquata]
MDIVMTAILQRLESMDTRLAKLDSIESTVNNITQRTDKIEHKVNNLETKLCDIANSRAFESDQIEYIQQKQTEIELKLKEIKTAQEQSIKESDIEYRRIEQQRQELSKNLIFYKIPDIDDDDNECKIEILKFIENEMKIPDATKTIKIESATRWGKFKEEKTRPVQVIFEIFPDREKVRNKLI